MSDIAKHIETLRELRAELHRDEEASAHFNLMDAVFLAQSQIAAIDAVLAALEQALDDRAKLADEVLFQRQRAEKAEQERDDYRARAIERAREIEGLKDASVRLADRAEKAEQEVAALRTALSDLLDEQNGVPLFRREEQYNAAVEAARQALERARVAPEQHGNCTFPCAECDSVGEAEDVPRSTQEEGEALIGTPKPDCCEICARSGLTLTADHDHKTGKYRGWLCHLCNLAIGNARDNPQLLRRMADWLEEHQSCASQSPNGTPEAKATIAVDVISTSSLSPVPVVK